MEKLWAPWRMEYIQSSLMDDPGKCVFCLDGDDEQTKKFIIFRGESAFVIMNKFPYNNGHLLVVPYRHIAEFNELGDDELLEMQRLMGKCIKALRETMHPHGFNIGMNLGRTAGAGIDDHVHYHIVPRWDGDTNFMPILGETKVVSEALEKSCQRLKKCFGK